MRTLVSALPLVVLLGCAGTVEVDTGAALGSEGPYDSQESAPLPTADSPHMRLVSGGAEYRASFTVELLYSGGLDGVYDGWCTDSHAAAPGAELQPVELHWSDGVAPVGIVEQPQNLDLLNYLLNAYEVGDLIDLGMDEYGSPWVEPLTELDIQDAVWALIDDVDPEWAEVWPQVAALVNEVRARGEGFVPDCGDVVVVLAVPLENLDGTADNDVQTIAVEVPFVARRCF